MTCARNRSCRALSLNRPRTPLTASLTRRKGTTPMRALYPSAFRRASSSVAPVSVSRMDHPAFLHTANKSAVLHRDSFSRSFGASRPLGLFQLSKIEVGVRWRVTVLLL